MSFSADLKALTDEVSRSLPLEHRQLLDSFLADLEETLPRNRPLGPGDEIEPFVLANAAGRSVSSTDLMVRGPLVVVFYRGAWCPWCNLQLKALQDNLDEIHELGAQLVAISPMTPDNTLTFAEKKGLTFEVLSDQGFQVARSFGLVYELKPAMQAFHEAIGVDLAQFNGDSGLELLTPATYVIDDGVVVARVEVDFRNRMDPLEVIAALQKLK